MSSDPVSASRGPAAHFGTHVETLKARHDHALERSGAACAVIYSGAPHTAFLDDRAYPFVANPHFLAWVPLTELPQSYVIYRPGEPPRLVYYQPRDYWHVVPEAPAGFWAGEFDIRIVTTPEAAADHLPVEPEKCIFIGEADDPGPALGIERQNPTAALNSLHFARGVKTDYELACLRLASTRGVRGHRAAEAAFRDGASEFDIHRAYCAAVSHTDNELPYANIVALNEHGAVLHYTNYEREAPAEARSLLIDAGAREYGYASDITRTFSRSSRSFAELIGLMEALQLDVVGRIRAGINYADLHIETHRLLGETLVTAGLAKGDADTLLATGVTAAFFPHGLGHLIGLQVHDVGGHMADENGTRTDPPSGHPYLRLTRDLEADMVLTVEPGLYFIDMLLDNLRGSPAEAHVTWDEVERLKPFGGIRIEDDVRVLGDGVENLTRNAFAA
ncbi:MAG: Xaa-Pro dipeptidase [Woeseiaceae bacterium]|nr:Xaa-Pro dipeptidase [Woeseiaceae bacterium]